MSAPAVDVFSPTMQADMEPFRYGKGLDPKAKEVAKATRLQRLGLVNAVPTDKPEGGWWLMVTWTDKGAAGMKVKAK